MQRQIQTSGKEGVEVGIKIQAFFAELGFIPVVKNLLNL